MTGDFTGFANTRFRSSGDIDPGIEHIDRDRYSQLVVGSFAFEVIDQLFGPRVIVVNDLAELAAILWIHLVEELAQKHRVLVIARKDDRLARDLAGGVFLPVFHQVAQDHPVCVLVVDDLVDVLRREVVLRRVFTLLFKLLDLFR